MQIDLNRYRLKLATTDEDRHGAERLRYRVFVEEMGAEATPEQHALRREWDSFDPWFDQLILIDRESVVADPLDRVVGAYRLLPDTVARSGPGFYSAGEFDLTPLLAIDRRSVELGRSCIAREHRGGPALHLLFGGLATYVLERGIEIMFGVASFPGTDPAPHAEALSYLRQAHPPPPDLAVRVRPAQALDLEPLPPEAIDAARAFKAMPPLIKAYLRLGAFFGEGAWIDHVFNTIDVCVVMDTSRMTARYRDFYVRGKEGSGA